MKQALVTGADRGVGLALTEALLTRGYRVFAGRYSEEEAGLGELRIRHAEALVPVRLDVGDDASVQVAAEAVSRRTDRIDLIVNNAGILGDIEATVLDPLDFADMLNVFNVNALGALRVTRAFLPLLLLGEDKLVVNISSEAGSVGRNARDAWFGYCMSKSALNMQSNLVHQGIRAHGGRVLVIHPGWVRTYMRGRLDADATSSPAESAAGILTRIDEELAAPRTDAPRYLAFDGEELPW